MQKTILITGGAGFIGSAVIRHMIAHTDYKIINVDCLTYAGNLDSLAAVQDDPRYVFEKVNICNSSEINRLFELYQPCGIMHLAAESHVDRSIDSPSDFIHTNILGTYTLLQSAKDYWSRLSNELKSKFRFHHISTDEVYGSLGGFGMFSEDTAYQPNSPYSASKAASDHLVRAWHHTYGLPVVTTNCSNNYGPFHFPEKLIPLTILNAIEGKPLPVYGNGQQIRDWLYVEDHAKALALVFEKGRLGEVYNIGGHNEQKNLTVVELICEFLEELNPNKPHGLIHYHDLITYVKDRPGHDQRYAIDAGKIQRELGWLPEESFESGLRKTVLWYLNNKSWLNRVRDGTYQGERLGIIS